MPKTLCTARQSPTGNRFCLVASQTEFLLFFSLPRSFSVSVLYSYSASHSSFLLLVPRPVRHSLVGLAAVINFNCCLPAPVVSDNYSNGSASGVVVVSGQVKIQLSGERAEWTFYVENKNKKKKTQKKKERLWPIFWIWVGNFVRSKRNERIQYYSPHCKNRHLVFHMIFALPATYFKFQARSTKSN